MIWVGPSYKTINALGDKVSARELAAKVGVPTVCIAVHSRLSNI